MNKIVALNNQATLIESNKIYIDYFNPAITSSNNKVLISNMVKTFESSNCDKFVPVEISAMILKYLDWSIDTLNKELTKWCDNFNKIFPEEILNTKKYFDAKFSCNGKEMIFNTFYNSDGFCKAMPIDCKDDQANSAINSIYANNLMIGLLRYLDSLKEIEGLAKKKNSLDNLLYFEPDYQSFNKMETASTTQSIKFSMVIMSTFDFFYENRSAVFKTQRKNMIKSTIKMFQQFHFHQYLLQALYLYNSKSINEYLNENYSHQFSREKFVNLLNENIQKHYCCNKKTGDTIIRCKGIEVNYLQYVHFNLTLKYEKKLQATGSDTGRAAQFLNSFHINGFGFLISKRISKLQSINITGEYRNRAPVVFYEFDITIVDITQIIRNLYKGVPAFNNMPKFSKIKEVRDIYKKNQ
ncbi:MAG: hypothetical protein GY730_04095 [bacterium]|nr:hypothetical protein [bacterium]